MDDINNDLQQQALEIIDQLPDISEDQLEALRNSSQLRGLCRELLALKGDLYLHEHPVMKEDRVKFIQETQEEDSSWGKTLLRWLLPLAAVAAVVAFIFFFQKEKVDTPEGRVFTASTEGSRAIEMMVGKEPISLSVKEEAQEQKITMDDYREILSNVDPSEQVALKVPAGQSSDITLSDGSVVSLHPGSRLAFPAVFTSTERVVKLEGEAYFNVVHDSKRPFIVITGMTETTVLGTEFDIDTRDGSSTVVTLVKGRVQVKNKMQNNKVVLEPGMQTTANDMGFSPLAQVDTAPYSYWAEGYLFFDQTELQDIMRKIGLMYNMTVEFRNTGIMNLKVRFFAERKNGLEAVINRLNSLQRIHVTRSGNTLYVD